MHPRTLIVLASFAVAVFAQRKAPELIPTGLVKKSSWGALAVVEVRLPPLEEPVRITSFGPMGKPIDTVIGPKGSDPRALVGVGASTVAGMARVEVNLSTGVWEGEVAVPRPEPGFVMHLNPGFHYDPVWWNTQSDYAEGGTRLEGHQGPGIALVEEYLDFLEREPAAKAVLHQLPYIKSFLEAKPWMRERLIKALGDKRMVLVGGSYNEFASTLVGPEVAIRNLSIGSRWCQETLGEVSGITWQCDVFGHDPAFPSLIASAGKQFTAFARGPFHQWGVLHELASSAKGGMNFPSEFYWMGPDGQRVFTHYMPGHYGYAYARLARGRNDAPPLQRAETLIGGMFDDLRTMALTHHIMLPMHEDFVRPMTGLGELVEAWNQRYESPKLVIDSPKEFFNSVLHEVAERKIPVPTISRDMNPIYTGCGVSFIDLKLAQRRAESELLDAEALATLAASGGLGRTRVPYPAARLARAWRQLAFNSHHDGVTGSMSDQVYIDIMQGYQDVMRIARETRTKALLAVDTDSTREWGSLEDEAFASAKINEDSISANLANRTDPWISNGVITVVVDARKGGCVTSIKDASGREWLSGPADDLIVIEEGSLLPGQGEGPWHLVPRKTLRRMSSTTAVVESVTRSSITVRRSDALFDALTTYRLDPREPEVQVEQKVLRWRGRDTMLRVAYPMAMRGLRPYFETNGAVVGRPFARDVDAFEDPWTLDNVAWRWAGLDAPATLRLRGENRAPLRAFAVVEIVVPDDIDAGGMEDVTGWVKVLAGWGVTATVTRASARRYGDLKFDSDRPDLRIALGSPKQNPLVAAAWDGHDPRETRGPILVSGRDGVDVFAAGPGTWIPDPKDPRSLEVVADFRTTKDAPPDVARAALINRGNVSYHITENGTMAINLLRSCTGWPSGIWLDEPQRRPPDGSPFEAMHGSHTFEYALRLGRGDAARSQFAKSARRFTHRTIVDPQNSHFTEWVSTSPDTCEVLAIKVPDAAPSRENTARTEESLIVRVWNSSPIHTDAKITLPFEIASATRCDHTELAPSAGALRVNEQVVSVMLAPCEIATIRIGLKQSLNIEALPPSRIPSAPWLENLGEGVDGNGAVVVAPLTRILEVGNEPQSLTFDVAAPLGGTDGGETAIAGVRIFAGSEFAASPALEVRPSAFPAFTMPLQVGTTRRFEVEIVRRRATPSQRIPLHIEVQTAHGTVLTTVWIHDPSIEKAAARDIEWVLDTPAIVTGNVGARLLNHSGGTIEGVATVVAPTVVVRSQEVTFEHVVVPPDHGEKHVTQSVAHPTSSWLMFTFRGEGTAIYSETCALLSSPDEVVISFVDDRARLVTNGVSTTRLVLIGMAQGPLADVTKAVNGISLEASGLKITKGRPEVESRGGGMRVSIPLEIKHEGGPARGVIAANAVFGSATLPFVTTPRMSAKRADTPIVVDADLSEWTEADWVEARGRDDARFSAKWSPEGLWFAAEVKDQTHRQLKDDGTIWMHDSIQIAITPEPSSRLGYTGTDLEFGVALGPQTPVVWSWYSGDGGQTGKVSTDVAVRRDAGVTRYEWFIPAARLPKVRLEANRVIGFSWIANDDDGEGYAGASQWSEGMTGGKDSSMFGSLILN